MFGSTRRMGKVPMVMLTISLALLALHGFADTDQGEDEVSFVGRSENPVTEAVDRPTGGGSGGATAEETSPEPAARPSRDKLSVHGFFTQAWVTGSYVDVPAETGLASPTATELNLGIPEDGTTNYRFLALQFRYEMTPKDLFIVQLSSRALGNAPIGLLEDEIELDWAFYERRLTDYMKLKVGRVQIPLGIFNEIRDVGTILPYYRPPYNFYREGSFTSETVDGVVLANTFWPEASWNLDASIYGGEWDLFETDFNDVTNSDYARATDGYGLQLWLNTSVPGLRFGFGGNKRKLTGGVFRPAGVKGDTITDWYASVDASFSRFVFRGEFQASDNTFEIPLGVIELNGRSYYGQAGYLINDKVHVWLQYDVADVDPKAVFYVDGQGAKRKIREDLAVSLNYFFAPNVVLKAEYHDVEENSAILVPVVTPTGVLFYNQEVHLPNGNYTIISLSVSF